ncbi:MAG: PEP-utilizing enzyme [Verrucomicrobiia bacterium]
MARSLQIPAVVGLQDASRRLKSGDYVLLDGFNGHVVANPTDQRLLEYGQLAQRRVKLDERLRDVVGKPAVTLDGVRVSLILAHAEALAYRVAPELFEGYAAKSKE